MSYKAYNDYELLYLANTYEDVVALELLVKKYEKFIYKKIVSFFPFDDDLGDYFQEGLLCLYKAIQSFDDGYNKTFMRYFEVLINRCFINLYHKNKKDREKIIMLINEEQVKEDTYYEKEEIKKVTPVFSSQNEQYIYQTYFVEGKTIDELALSLKQTKKQIYNSIYRVKKKIQEQLKDI